MTSFRHDLARETGPCASRADTPIRRSSSIHQLEGAALVEVVVCETHKAALQTATVTSAANALGRHGRVAQPMLIRDFVPHPPPFLPALAGWLRDADMDGRPSAAVESFFSALRPARRHLERFLEDVDDLGLSRAEALNRHLVAGSWKSACRSAAAAVRSLDHSFRGLLPAHCTDSVAILVGLLNGAADGFDPCIDSSGKLFLPELPQRRRSARKGLFQPCRVRCNRDWRDALARDVSPGGLGLEGVEGLRPRDTVVVDMRSGRRLVGCVMWVDGPMCGVGFGTPLPPNDPLLFG